VVAVDENYMKMALSLAGRARGRTSPNPMVGAVVVKDDEVVGRGYHRKAGGPHAEILALEQAGDRARGATLYVTLEPCNHTGRTPPCTRAILEKGIAKVVAGMKDPNPAVAGGGLEFLAGHGVETVSGVCEGECRRLNEVFIKYITSATPFVILKCAATLDGRIATATGDSKWITGPRSRHFVHELRNAVDAILVGIGTILKDNPRLTTRLEGMEGMDPVRIVLDTHLSIPPDAQVLHVDSNSDTLIVTGYDISPEKRKAIEQTGARLLTTDCRKGSVDLKALVKALGKMEITSVLIEGGATINGSALRAGIVDKVLLFYAPKLCAGDDGVPICRGPGVRAMRESMRVCDVSVHRFDDDIMIEGYINSH